MVPFTCPVGVTPSAVVSGAAPGAAVVPAVILCRAVAVVTGAPAVHPQERGGVTRPAGVARPVVCIPGHRDRGGVGAVAS